MNNDLISRQAAIERATKEHDFFRGAVTVSDKARRDELLNVMCWLGELPSAQPHTYRGVTLNDVMMYFDSLEGSEDAWTEFCCCLECRGWGLYRIRSATDKNVGTTDTINRQQAIDAVTDELDTIDHVPQWVFDRLEKRLKQLPPAQPDIPDDARDAFINLVYDELHSDGDNNRANRIIDAADEYVEYSLAKQSAQLGANLAEVSTDTISRQEAIDAVNCVMVMKGIRSGKGITAEAVDCAKRIIADNIRQLPPIQPEIEPLTDKEQRIFLAAMGRERKVCKEVDDQYTHEPYEVLLTKVCDEIERKVKGALWT